MWYLPYCSHHDYFVGRIYAEYGATCFLWNHECTNGKAVDIGAGEKLYLDLLWY